MDESAGNFDLATAEPLAQAADEPADLALVAAACAGDEAAFEQLFERHRQRVARVAGRFFQRRDQVEEVIQESFTKAYFALNDYSGERGSSFAAWISRIAINVCYDELRRMRRRPTFAISDITDEEATWLNVRLTQEGAGSDIEAEAIARDLASKLLARLSADDRLVLTLLDAEGLSVAEIAEQTGWSVPKVKVRAHRARRALRSVLRKFL
jgi:RNA polymerase sigma-70 factor (ECF subfamily)